MKQRIPVTLKQIAGVAGVSATAVSFALNGSGRAQRLAPATVARVQAVARRLGYVANHHARAIARRRTMLVGVIIGELDHSFWPTVIAGLEAELEPEGYRMVLASTGSRPEREHEQLAFMGRAGVDAIVYCPGVHPRNRALDAARAMAQERPVVAMINPVPGLVSVWNDQEAIGAAAAERLLDLGHRRLAYIGSLRPHDRRGPAFIAAAERGGGQVAAFGDVDGFLAAAERRSAVFCYSDYLVIELYGKAARRGLAIPRDLSVIGCNDLEFLDWLTPRPVSAHPFKRELGAAVGRTVLAALAGRPPPPEDQRRLIPGLSPGGSLAEPRTPGPER